MKCLNDPARSYTGNEPSPKGIGRCAHAEKVKTRMRGKDGRYWEVRKDKNGTKSWKVSAGQGAATSSLPVEKQLARIGWRTTNPVDTANIGYDAEDKRIPLPDEIWKYKPGVRKGDRVALAWAYSKDIPPLSVPVKGTTLRDIFVSIATGMKAKLKVTPETSRFLDSYLPNHGKGDQFAKMYAEGTLTPYHFVRDAYDFWEGGLVREGNVWQYGLGS